MYKKDSIYSKRLPFPVSYRCHPFAKSIDTSLHFHVIAAPVCASEKDKAQPFYGLVQF